MHADRIADALRRGTGAAARAIGTWHDLFRPAGAESPVAMARRVMKLPAALTLPDGGFSKPPGYGSSLWWAVLDAAYVRPGDYLVGKGGTWFVASTEPLMPVLCVEAFRVLDVTRPTAATAAGVNGYGGVNRGVSTVLLTGWPASVLAAGGGGFEASLPGDGGLPSWQVLLPITPGVVLRTGDLIADDLGRNGTVASAELTRLGWRLGVRQAAS